MAYLTYTFYKLWLCRWPFSRGIGESLPTLGPRAPHAGGLSPLAWMSPAWEIYLSISIYLNKYIYTYIYTFITVYSIHIYIYTYLASNTRISIHGRA